MNLVEHVGIEFDGHVIRREDLSQDSELQQIKTKKGIWNIFIWECRAKECAVHDSISVVWKGGSRPISRHNKRETTKRTICSAHAGRPWFASAALAIGVIFWILTGGSAAIGSITLGLHVSQRSPKEFHLSFFFYVFWNEITLVDILQQIK